MSYIIITDDGKMFPFDPNGWAFIKNKDLEDGGAYDPKQQIVKIERDKVTMRFSQLMPPLVKIR